MDVFYKLKLLEEKTLNTNEFYKLKLLEEEPLNTNEFYKRKIWEEEEVKKLKQEFYIDKLDIEIIAKNHDRTSMAIIRKLKKISIHKTNCPLNHKKWHNYEVEQLKKEYLEDNVNVEEIAKKHGRSVFAIENKIIEIRKLDKYFKRKYN